MESGIEYCVRVHIEGIQHSVSDERIVQNFEGICIRRNEKMFVRYNEEDGQGNSLPVILVLAPGSIALKRGKGCGNPAYETGKMTECAYATEYGTIAMQIETERIDYSESDTGICTAAFYTLTMNGMEIKDCELKVIIRVRR